MAKYLMRLILLLLVVTTPASAQVEPNSDFFLIRDFYHQDRDGNWVEYRVAGFAQPKVDGVTPRIWVLPSLSVDPAEIRFFDDSGNAFNPTNSNASRVYSIRVPIAYSGSLPNEPQQAAIGAALQGQSIEFWEYPWPTDNFGAPQMHPGAASNFQLAGMIRQTHDARKPYFDALKGHQDYYKQYQASAATLNEIKVAVLVDGQEVAAREYSGSVITYGSNLAPISFVAPSIYEVNKIRSGDFEVLVSFRFRDARTSYVDGKFNVRQVLRQFVEETQSATTRRKTSGWQVLGFGNRRSRLKRSMSQHFTHNTNVENLENTRIVTFDATDDMIERFEAAFFPNLSRQDVINRHLQAAQQADDAGRSELAKVHRDYANSLANNDPSLEVDIEKAAAALSAQDYVGFLAHGVRFSDTNNQATDSFRRVINTSVEIDERTEWLDYRTVSAQRETSIPVPIERETRTRGSLGLCDANPGPYRLRSYGTVRQVNSLLVTCIQTGSPIHRAGFLPGSILLKVDGQLPTTFQGLEQLLDGTRPGEDIRIEYVAAEMPQGTQVGEEWVTLTRGKPVP